ncbi:MAG TPA: hypothetical protein PK129_05400 [Cellvibrionaceae bacterium]|nr:hypothetical protein [Cellvibrionaceae bacterium]
MSLETQPQIRPEHLKPKSRWAWLIPVGSVAVIAWLGNTLIHVFGDAAILRAGIAAQSEPAWIIGMCLLRLGLYYLSIMVLRKQLARRQFTPTEIKDSTWMMARVCALYEVLFGIKLFSVLSQLMN